MQAKDILSVTRPDNGFEKEIGMSGLWVLLFGFLYFLYHGMWGWAVIHLAVTIGTAGIGYFAFPFFARNMVIRSYLERGWNIGKTK